jgi:hypothetical protein
MMADEIKPKVIFAPGCFDSFEGTQEELEELIASIHAAVESGEFLENSISVDDMSDEDLAELETVMERNESKIIQ